MTDRTKALTISTSSSDSVTVVLVGGLLDMSTADTLESTVLELFRPENFVIIDLSGLSICDSTGLGALVRLHRRSLVAGSRIAVRGPRQHIADMLTMTGISKVIEVLPAEA